MYTHEEVRLVEFMYPVFTRMSGESYRRRLGSLLYLCYVFRAKLTPLCVDSVQALWASLCSRLLQSIVKVPCVIGVYNGHGQTIMYLPCLQSRKHEEE